MARSPLLRPPTEDERAALTKITRAKRQSCLRVIQAKALLAVTSDVSSRGAVDQAALQSYPMLDRLVKRWNTDGLSALAPPETPASRNGKTAESPRTRQSNGAGTRAAAAMTTPLPTEPAKPRSSSSHRRKAISAIRRLPGAIAAALADLDTGEIIEKSGRFGFDLDVAVAGNREVLRAKLQVKEQLGLTDEIEDILITMKHQYHLIRMSRSHERRFMYLALARPKANLAMARRALVKIDEDYAAQKSATANATPATAASV